jgi:hypothetical protein
MKGLDSGKKMGRLAAAGRLFIGKVKDLNRVRKKTRTRTKGGTWQ